jgi:hypothetical protein
MSGFVESKRQDRVSKQGIDCRRRSFPQFVYKPFMNFKALNLAGREGIRAEVEGRAATAVAWVLA